MGFNNDGLDAVRARLAGQEACPGPLGANIGANRDAADPVADYVACLRGLYQLVDYLTVNVSSPNTPGLRDLQGRTRLDELLAALVEARSALAGSSRPSRCCSRSRRIWSRTPRQGLPRWRSRAASTA